MYNLIWFDLIDYLAVKQRIRCFTYTQSAVASWRVPRDRSGHRNTPTSTRTASTARGSYELRVASSYSSRSVRSCWRDTTPVDSTTSRSLTATPPNTRSAGMQSSPQFYRLIDHSERLSLLTDTDSKKSGNKTLKTVKYVKKVFKR